MGKRAKILLISLASLVLVFGFLQTSLMSRVRGVAWQGWVKIVARTARLRFIDLPEDVGQQVAVLRGENIQLRAELARYERLTQQLGVTPAADYRAIPALVMARPVDAFRSEYVINQGTAGGVTIGAPIVIFGSTLVGFVTEVREQSAIFRLLLHPATQIEAETVPREDGQEPARGLASGRQYTGLMLTTVPRGVPLATGMPLVTREKSGVFPSGLLLGEVGEVISREHDAYQEAAIALPYDPDEIEAVQILVIQGTP